MTRIAGQPPPPVDHPPSTDGGSATKTQAVQRVDPSDAGMPPGSPPVAAVVALDSGDIARLIAALAQMTAEQPALSLARVAAWLATDDAQKAVPPQLLQQTRALILPELPTEDVHETARLLKHLVEDGGAFFEAHVARALERPATAAPLLPATDLRVLIGRLRSSAALHRPPIDSQSGGVAIEGETPAAVPHESSVLDRAGASLLADQLSSTIHADQTGTWQMTWTLHLGGVPVQVQCAIEPAADEGGGQSERRGLRSLSLVLSAGDVPAVEARFAWTTSAVAVTLYVRTDGDRQTLEPHREALLEGIRAAGFASATCEIWTNPARLAMATARNAAPVDARMRADA